LLNSILPLNIVQVRNNKRSARKGHTMPSSTSKGRQPRKRPNKQSPKSSTETATIGQNGSDGESDGITEAIEAASELIHPDEIDGVPTNKAMRRDAKELTAQEKKKVALGMRLMGMTFQEIADRLGYAGWQGAQQLVKRALDEYTVETARDLRNLQYARLEQIILLNWPEVMRKDPQSTALVLGTMDRIARMFGLEQHERFPADYDETEEGVMTIGGDKDQFIEGLRKARKELGGG
jgi:hypothetical protein